MHSKKKNIIRDVTACNDLSDDSTPSCSLSMLGLDFDTEMLLFLLTAPSNRSVLGTAINMHRAQLMVALRSGAVQPTSESLFHMMTLHHSYMTVTMTRE